MVRRRLASLLPNGNEACVVDGVRHAFHGETWRREWQARHDGDTVELSLALETLPLTVVRRIELDGALLVVAERVRNEGEAPVRFMWGHHPALGGEFLEPGCRIELAGGTTLGYNEPLDPRSRLGVGWRDRWPNGRTVARVDSGDIKYTDPKLVQPLERLVQLRENGCVNEDASTRKNSDANNLFISKKTAMVLIYPAVISTFEDALGKNLGVAPIPVSGDGPLAGRVAGNSFHNWVIPKDSPNPDVAWEFVKIASDATAGKQELQLLATPPANKSAGATVDDPIVRFFLDAAEDPAMPVLDSVIPVDVALFYYKQLQAAFAGKATPQQAMQNVEDALPRLNP